MANTSNPPAWALRTAWKVDEYYVRPTIDFEQVASIIAAEAPVTYGKDVVELVEAAKYAALRLAHIEADAQVNYRKEAKVGLDRLSTALAKFKEEK